MLLSSVLGIFLSGKVNCRVMPFKGHTEALSPYGFEIGLIGVF
jgi:hypothetical protein